MCAVTDALRGILRQAASVPIQSIDLLSVTGLRTSYEFAGALPADILEKLDAASADTQSTHSPDYRYCRWASVDYHFTPLQAACIRLLWEAMRNGKPALTQERILQQIDSCSKRLSYLFRTTDNKPHPAWGVMIVSPRRGVFQLAVAPA